MALYLVFGISDDLWLSAANRSRTMKAAIEDVGVSKYVAWMNLAKKHRPDLVAAMRATLIVSREQARLPRCSRGGCGRPAKARGLCKRDYEDWLVGASAESKVRRVNYPSDQQIVEWFKIDHSIGKVARRIGVARETLRDYIAYRPDLYAQTEAYRRPPLLPPEVAKANDDASRRRWREANAGAVRAINRRWGKNQDREKRRRWNTYNRLRRMNQLTALSPEEVMESAEYAAIVRADPCAYCGDSAGTVDHIRPINSAGTDRWENLAGACHSCNAQKNDKELLHYLLWRMDRVASEGGGTNPVDPDGRR